jgi:hypothetical protein
MLDDLLWKMKMTSDWKILGQRRTIRLHLQEKIIAGGSEPKEVNETYGEPEGGKATISFREAWKALGKRKQYRSPPQSAPPTPSNRNTPDLLRELRAAAVSTRVGERGEQNCSYKNASAGESPSPLERPHITTLYFLEELEKYK